MLFENSLQDLRYAARQLRKSPGFTLTVALMLAVGIGANLTVFMVLDGVLLRPLPFPHPEQLVSIARSFPNGIAPTYTGSTASFLRRESRAFESVAAYDFVPGTESLMQGNDPNPIQVLHATSDFFHVFQMEPSLGRGFSPQDMIPKAPGVVILSDGLWRRQFAADTHILGRTINLGNSTYTVIGVASGKFRLGDRADAWIPLPIIESGEDQTEVYRVAARLKPGVTASQATSDLKRVLLRLKHEYPHLLSQNESVRVQDFHESLTGDMRPALDMLMGAVALVLLIVAANILSLLLTRAVTRRRELDLRVALGASGWLVLRQLLIENALLFFLGGIGGVLLAYFGAPLLMRFSPLALPEFVSMRIGYPAIAFAAMLTSSCALLCSLVPVFEARRAQRNELLRMNSTPIATGRYGAQKILVVTEVAIAMVLLVGAELLLTSFWKLIHTSPGVQTANVLTFKTSFTADQAATSALLSQRIDEITRRIEALPGVESAAAADTLPTQLVPDLSFNIVGRSADRGDANGDAKYIPVTAHFFTALVVPIQMGRAFALSDTHDSLPVLIVNQQFVRTYFKNENPLGQHVHIDGPMGPSFADPSREIVGVVGDVKQNGLNAPVPESLYLPATQIPDQLAHLINGSLGMSWMVRTRSAQTELLPSIRRIFMENAHAPLLAVEPMDNVINDSVAQQRFSMILLCGFGLIALVLGATGLYGVMSYTVARQTREIGIRMALGAQRGEIAYMVLRGATNLMLMGSALGIAASLAGARILSSLLFGVAPRDTLSLATASGILLLTGLLAAWMPARRAASIEPMQALRTE